MSAPRREDFSDVQRVVLAGGCDKGRPWATAQHLMLGFGEPARPLSFLESLKSSGLWPTAAGDGKPPSPLEVSLGFTRRGLERAQVRRFAMGIFAAKAPAFSAGAAVRGPAHAGAHGANAPRTWEQAFDFMTLDAVLSLHAMDASAVDKAVESVEAAARDACVSARRLPRSKWDYDAQGDPKVPFGYRDSLSGVGIQGWTREPALKQLLDISCHAAGEFVLGHAQNSGANPWLASGTQVWPERLRAFFRNASFGVLHQVEQDVAKFDQFVTQAANDNRVDAETIRTKLCGRNSAGQPAGRAPLGSPTEDHDYENDSEGFACPFGAHARRMNPRANTPRAHTRARPLLRRSMPYSDGASRGLMGLFFCASIEDQFEHLLGQWADDAPLGSENPDGARDPLIGAHQPGDGPFVIPLRGRAPIVLRDLPPFTRTRGTAYLFYPSLAALEQIARDCVFPLGEKVDPR